MRNTSMSQTITLNTKAYQWSGFTSADYGSWRYAGGGLASEFSYLTNQVKVGGGKQSSELSGTSQSRISPMRRVRVRALVASWIRTMSVSWCSPVPCRRRCRERISSPASGAS